MLSEALRKKEIQDGCLKVTRFCLRPLTSLAHDSDLKRHSFGLKIYPPTFVFKFSFISFSC